TTGSLSITESGTALRKAAAEVRALLLQRASERLGAGLDELAVDDGPVYAAARSSTYWGLAGGRPLGRAASGAAPAKPPGAHRLVGTRGRGRADLRAIVTGTARYVHDLDH